MKKTIFWVGAIILVVGVVFLAYGYSTIQNTIAQASISGVEYYLYRYPQYRLQWDLANILQPVGIGALVLGAIMLAYGLLAKK